MKAHIGQKQREYYRGLLVKADPGLHEQVADRLRARLAPGGRVLDLGAGEGALSARLSDLGFKVTAADCDDESFACAEVPFTRVDFDDSRAMEQFVTDHEDGFDAVIGIEVIEHVQDQWRYVRQLTRMVAAGGVVVITTPNVSSWMSRLMFFFRGRFHQFSDSDLEYGHINPVTPWELELILTRSGLQDVSIYPAGTLPPLYLSGLNAMTLLNLLVLPLRPLMRGMLDGWCVLAVGRKPSGDQLPVTTRP